MKKTFLCFGVGILAFLISLGIVFFFAFRSTYGLETSKNVCQKCLDISKTENLETKSLSEIIADKTYQGKKVRLKALFNHDAGYIFFQDLNNGKNTLAAGFGKNAILCADTEKTLQVCTGYKTWYDSSVEVIVVGYLGKVDKDTNPFQGGNDGFNIICVEQVNPTDEQLETGKAKFETSLFNFIELFVSK